MARETIQGTIDSVRPLIDRFGSRFAHIAAVRSVATEFEEELGLGASGYIDLELSNGTALTWWIEVTAEAGQWKVDTSLLLNAGRGQHPIHTFPERIARSPDDLMRAVISSLHSVIYLPFYISKITHTAFDVSADPSAIALDAYTANDAAVEILLAESSGAKVTMQSAEDMIQSSYQNRHSVQLSYA